MSKSVTSKFKKKRNGLDSGCLEGLSVDGNCGLSRPIIGMRGLYIGDGVIDPSPTRLRRVSGKKLRRKSDYLWSSRAVASPTETCKVGMQRRICRETKRSTYVFKC
jgi:hypothetical protein